MNKYIKRVITFGTSIASLALTLIPDSMIGCVKVSDRLTYEQNLLVDRLAILVGSVILSTIMISLCFLIRCRVTIKGRNYRIQVEYGNIFKYKKCQKVINFDECFSAKVGTMPHEIKQTSVCGQFLTANPDADIQVIITEFGLKPEREKSKYNNKAKYTSGEVVPYKDYLLLAFAMLDPNGRAYFPTKDDYLKSLATMWTGIHKHFQMKDVCIPVLGGGLTTIGESNLTNQELIDLIIYSYKLYANKIKNPYKLRIVCRRKDGISLRKIGESI